MTAKRKKVAKSLHAQGLEPEIFRTADAHATNRLRKGPGLSAKLLQYRYLC